MSFSSSPDGNTIYTGFPYHNERRGKVDIFQKKEISSNILSYSLVYTLEPIEILAEDNFGWSVELTPDEKYLLVGAPSFEIFSQGRIFVYDNEELRLNFDTNTMVNPIQIIVEPPFNEDVIEFGYNIKSNDIGFVTSILSDERVYVIVYLLKEGIYEVDNIIIRRRETLTSNQISLGITDDTDIFQVGTGLITNNTQDQFINTFLVRDFGPTLTYVSSSLTMYCPRRTAFGFWIYPNHEMKTDILLAQYHSSGTMYMEQYIQGNTLLIRTNRDYHLPIFKYEPTFIVVIGDVHRLSIFTIGPYSQERQYRTSIPMPQEWSVSISGYPHTLPRIYHNVRQTKYECKWIRDQWLGRNYIQLPNSSLSLHGYDNVIHPSIRQKRISPIETIQHHPEKNVYRFGPNTEPMTIGIRSLAGQGSSGGLYGPFLDAECTFSKSSLQELYYIQAGEAGRQVPSGLDLSATNNEVFSQFTPGGGTQDNNGLFTSFGQGGLGRSNGLNASNQLGPYYAGGGGQANIMTPLRWYSTNQSTDAFQLVFSQCGGSGGMIHATDGQSIPLSSDALDYTFIGHPLDDERFYLGDYVNGFISAPFVTSYSQRGKGEDVVSNTFISGGGPSGGHFGGKYTIANVARGGFSFYHPNLTIYSTDNVFY